MPFLVESALRIEDMVSSCWVCRKLPYFGAGIEVSISFLKIL
ncbi:hypothetical protein X772_34465 [Mesorhizobium sp. LSJC280B00]|nr:hypothetical protein X772_34465 [Mesorhizobium sp. LSJC280B00]